MLAEEFEFEVRGDSGACTDLGREAVALSRKWAEARNVLLHSQRLISDCNYLER